MFKDKYKKDNDMINPSQENIEKLKGEIKKNKMKSSKSKYYLSLVAAVVLIPIVSIILYQMKNQNVDESSIDKEIPVLSVNSRIKDITKYDDVYDYLAKINKEQNKQNKSIMYEEKSAEQNNLVTRADATNNEFTDTNMQVEGVQEADVIKTDGNYVYYIRDGKIYIVKADKGNTKILSSIENKSENNKTYNINEMYINKDKLIVIRSVYECINLHNYSEKSRVYRDDIIGQNYYLYVDIYDISNKEKPKKINTLGQDGCYLSSRMIENNLYVCTNKYLDFDTVEKDKKETYIPEIFINDKEEVIDNKDIYIQKDSKESNFLILTSIDLDNSEKYLQTKAILGSGQDMYVNKSNMYIVSSRKEVKIRTIYDKSDIVKFEINNGNIEYKCSNSVDGTILNQFSMDEYDNYFRIVTTGRKECINGLSNDEDDSVNNGLFVLDDNLNIVGGVTGVAKGEHVYSVRFDKETAYFVTFKQVDPLFAVDLSNPEKPTILGELKVSGFSEYMHPYGDNLLLGLGKESDEKTGMITGLKLSMFNIKDKTNIVEINKKVINEYAYETDFNNHKAITVIKEKGIISFPIYNGYLVFKYTEKNGFELLKQIPSYEYDFQTRGIYINGYLYIFSQNNINIYDEKFEKIKELNY